MAGSFIKMNSKRKGIWIPIEILKNEDLDVTNKLLLAEVYSLTELEEGCIASDGHFSKLLGITRSAVNKRITKLRKLNLIESERVYKDRQCVGRVITKPTNSPKKHTPILQRNTPVSQKDKGVFPTEHKPIRQENTINTSTNSNKLKQPVIQNTGGISKFDISEEEKLDRFKKLVQLKPDSFKEIEDRNFYYAVKSISKLIDWTTFYELVLKLSNKELELKLSQLGLQDDRDLIFDIRTHHIYYLNKLVK